MITWFEIQIRIGQNMFYSFLFIYYLYRSIENWRKYLNASSGCYLLTNGSYECVCILKTCYDIICCGHAFQQSKLYDVSSMCQLSCSKMTCLDYSVSGVITVFETRPSLSSLFFLLSYHQNEICCKKRHSLYSTQKPRGKEIKSWQE